MDLFSAIQKYVVKTRIGKADGKDIAAEIGRARHRCSSHRYCCCCAGAARKRDSSTSTHDLSTYVWHTEGDGVGISSSITADEDDRCSCRTGSSLGRRDCSSRLHAQQSNRCSSERQNAMCDASTSSFDLSTYVWGTEGDMYTTESGPGGNLEADGFVRDLGDADNCGKGWGGVDRKRPRAAVTTGGISSKGGEAATTPPRKKKRRIGNQD